MRAFFLGVVLCAGVVRAQVDEQYGLPSFAADAGVEPSAPPLPPPVEAPPPPPKPPPPPSWTKIGGSLSGLFTGLRDYFLGFEVTLLGTVVGVPARSEEVPGEVEGWVLQAGVQADYGRAGGALCRGTPFCASRAGGGLSLKGGWARGLPAVTDHVTRMQSMYFAQLDVLLTHFNIASAPLAPGMRTFELLTRLRLGVHLTAERSRVTTTGLTFFLAAVVEAIPVSSGTQGVSVGASAGLGL